MASTATDIVIQKINQAARSGRLDDAALLVARAVTDGLRSPILSALAGAVEFNRGEFETSVSYLQDAITHFPNDVVIRANLTEALYKLGRIVEARRFCDFAHAQLDGSLRLPRLGGFLAQEDGDFDAAVRFYRHVLDRQVDDWETWNNLGNAYRGLDNAEASVEALERALAIAPDARPVQVNLASALVDTGRMEEAEKLLNRLVAEEPGDAVPHRLRFTIYHALGREDDAFDAIRQAALAAPQDAVLQADFGQEAARRNVYDEAERAYEAALAIEPALGPAFVGLGSLFERMSREGELEPLRTRALNVAIDAESIAYLDALILKRTGDVAAAYDALERSGAVVMAGRRHHLRGVFLDRLGRPVEAIEAFEAMNAYWRDEPSRPMDRARAYRERVGRSIDLVTPDWVKGWSPANPPSDYPVPVFLVGFPRSGTTLLDTMLMGEKNVLVLEEEAFIGEIREGLGGIEALPSLDDAAISKARKSYFSKVAQRESFDRNSIVVDKHPMHLNDVPAIRRLFPSARFVLILRHPCDVILSCFITNFRANAAMSNFLDLADAATFYDLTFRNWEQARSLFSLPVHTVIYERLVHDQRSELSALFEWLGLSPPKHDFDHREAARARGTVLTASYAQVTEPIYTRAAGRWQRYRSFLEPVIPKLAPWVERFGYDL